MRVTSVIRATSLEGTWLDASSNPQLSAVTAAEGSTSIVDWSRGVQWVHAACYGAGLESVLAWDR